VQHFNLYPEAQTTVCPRFFGRGMTFCGRGANGASANVSELATTGGGVAQPIALRRKKSVKLYETKPQKVRAPPTLQSMHTSGAQSACARGRMGVARRRMLCPPAPPDAGGEADHPQALLGLHALGDQRPAGGPQGQRSARHHRPRRRAGGAELPSVPSGRHPERRHHFALGQPSQGLPPAMPPYRHPAIPPSPTVAVA
jgi:hypothetical protein